jgi:hypothetical protein
MGPICLSYGDKSSPPAPPPTQQPPYLSRAQGYRPCPGLLKLYPALFASRQAVVAVRGARPHSPGFYGLPVSLRQFLTEYISQVTVARHGVRNW